MGATLAIFGAAGHPWMSVPYLLILLTSALIYARAVSPSLRRGMSMVLVRDGRAFLEWPRPIKVWREMRSTLTQFFGLAVPLFLVITVLASLLDWIGVIPAIAGAAKSARVAAPPAARCRASGRARIDSERRHPAVRPEPHLAQAMTAGQLLVGVYLAGVLFPCMVTALTIAVEQSPRFVVKLLARQAIAALIFTLILAQVVAALGSLMNPSCLAEDELRRSRVARAALEEVSQGRPRRGDHPRCRRRRTRAAPRSGGRSMRPDASFAISPRPISAIPITTTRNAICGPRSPRAFAIACSMRARASRRHMPPHASGSRSSAATTRRSSR